MTARLAGEIGSFLLRRSECGGFFCIGDRSARRLRFAAAIRFSPIRRRSPRRLGIARACLAGPAADGRLHGQTQQLSESADLRRTTGNLNQKVYNAIEADLSRAASACAAGKDGEALGIIHATKEKHGYHV